MQRRGVEVKLRIEGMDCSACEFPIVVALKALKGVQEVSVKYEESEGRVIYDPDEIKVEELIDTISRVGFRAYLK